MSFLYKVSDKELVLLKNHVFEESGIPALLRQGFCRTPFSTGWFGKNNLGGFTYEFCRISDESRLDMVLVQINKGDRWVQLNLNIFRLEPEVSSLAQLEGLDGLKFHLPPNSRSLWRLAPPPGILFAGFPRHKIGFFVSKSGLAKQLDKLGRLLESDLDNIESFVRCWLEEHEVLVTDWKGQSVAGT